MRPAPRRPGNICTWSVMRAPGGVDQVDHRHEVLERLLLDADDLLDRLRPPRAGLHGRVVGHQRDRAAADRRHAGDHAVGAEAVLLPVGEQRVLDERVRRRRSRATRSRTGSLPCSLRLLVVALRPAAAGALERVLQVRHGPERVIGPRRSCERSAARADQLQHGRAARRSPAAAPSRPRSERREQRRAERRAGRRPARPRRRSIAAMSRRLHAWRRSSSRLTRLLPRCNSAHQTPWLS